MANLISARKHINSVYKRYVIDKIQGQCLSLGSYGAVYKTKCDDLPCAAILQHRTVFFPSYNDPGPVRISKVKYEEIERPSSGKLCQSLAGLNDSIIYTSCMKLKQDEISMLIQRLHEKEVEKQKIIVLKQYQEVIASLVRLLIKVEHLPPSRLLSCSKEQEYLATLLYKEIRTGGELCFDLYVVITLNIITHTQVVKSDFNTAQVYTNQLMTFVSDRVELKVSSENWTITQTNSNVVEKKAIDNFTPGISSWIPHSHFKASLPCAAHLAGNIPTLECEVHLNGFEAPHNKFTVHIDPSVMPAAGKLKLQKILKSGPIENPDRFFNNLAIDICDKYMEIGIDLGLQDKILRNELETGEFKMLQGSKKAMRMLQLWRQSIGEDNLTYSELASALEKHGFGHCAIKYCYS